MNNPLKPIVVIDGSQGIRGIIADIVKAWIAFSVLRLILIVIGCIVLALGFWAGRHGWLYPIMGLDAQFFGNPAAAHPHHYTLVPKPFAPRGSFCDTHPSMDQCSQVQSHQVTYCDEHPGGVGCHHFADYDGDRFIKRQDY
jgi:hypothetical protein